MFSLVFVCSRGEEGLCPGGVSARGGGGGGFSVTKSPRTSMTVGGTHPTGVHSCKFVSTSFNISMTMHGKTSARILC